MAPRAGPEEVPPTYKWSFPYDDMDASISDKEPDLDGVYRSDDDSDEDIASAYIPTLFDPMNFFDVMDPLDTGPMPYSNRCPGLLPVTAPINHAHLLYIHEHTIAREFGFNNPSLHIADAVVTALWNHDSVALRAFLNHTIKAFSFVYHNQKGSPFNDWTIQRHKNYVVVGHYQKFVSINLNYPLRLIVWERQVVYKIHKSGAWVPHLSSRHRKAQICKHLITDAVWHSHFTAEQGREAVKVINFDARMITNFITLFCAVPDDKGFCEVKTSEGTGDQHLNHKNMTGELL